MPWPGDITVYHEDDVKIDMAMARKNISATVTNTMAS